MDACRHRNGEPPIVAADEIREQTARILASDAFRAAPQLSAFLSYIVDAALDGRSGELKGYTIAVHALGRPADFDPQSDPIVRVEAGRLRKNLAGYYARDGAADPIRISIPLGGYSPAFERPAGEPGSGLTLSLPPASSAAAVATDAGGRRLGTRSWLLAAGLGFALLVFWRTPQHPAPEHPPVESARLETFEAVAAEMPRRTADREARLPVLGVRIPGANEDPMLDEGLRVFQRSLIDTLARFDDIVTVRIAADGTAPPAGLDYLFELGAFRLGEVVEGYGRLTSVSDGRVIWSSSRVQPARPVGEAVGLRELTRRIAVRLVEPFGVINADFRARSASPEIACLFRAMSARLVSRPDETAELRACLEKIVEKSPDFHPAWSQLAFLSVDDYVAGGPARAASLDVAMQAALNAVRLAPSSARAQQALMDVLFARGAPESGLQAGREALRRNPYNPDLLADVGARLVQLDRPAEGLPLLQKAVAQSSGRPAWYDAYLFIATRLAGDDKRADAPSVFFAVDEAPLSVVARAIADARQSESDAVRAISERFGTPVDLRALLGRMGFVPAAIDRLEQAMRPTEVEAAASTGK